MESQYLSYLARDLLSEVIRCPRVEKFGDPWVRTWGLSPREYGGRLWRRVAGLSSVFLARDAVKHDALIIDKAVS